MANYKELIPFIKKWEGGFANDPADAGGATMMGVTIATYTAYRRKKWLPEPSVDDLKRITEAEWEDIFKTLYWDRWRADEIEDQRVANTLVDWVWGSGKHGITIPQRLLGVADDGIVGVKTLAALNAKGADFLSEIYEARRAFIELICKRRPANQKFKKGWLNRLNDLHKS